MYEPRRFGGRCRRLVVVRGWRWGGVGYAGCEWRLPHMVIVDLLVWLCALVMIIILLSEPETCFLLWLIMACAG